MEPLLACCPGPGADTVPHFGASGLGEGEELVGLLRVHVEGCVFTVDRALLAGSCAYFRGLFRSGMRDSHTDELYLQGGLHPGGFLVALAVVRGERPPIPDADRLLEAVECAAFLQVEALESHLADILDTDNCLLLCQAAATYGLHKLFASAATFIRDSYRDLKWAAEKSLHPDILSYIESLTPASFIALGTHTPSMEMLHDSYRTVCHLDEEQGVWKFLTDLPVIASTSMAGVAALDGRLYVIGGVVGVNKVTVDCGFCYDPLTNSWCEIPGPAQSRYDFTLLGLEGKLYAVGGEHARQTMSSAEIFDVATGSWSFIKHAPRRIAGAAGTVCWRRIFVCFWKPPDITDIYEYVTAKDEWTLLTTLVRPQSYGHYMVAHRDNLYVMRNGPCDDFLHCLIECYNITTGQWSSLPGQYINSKGMLFTAVIRGDSALTVQRSVTMEFSVSSRGWRSRREMTGFPKSGSLWTCLLRLPRKGSTQRPESLNSVEDNDGEAAVEDDLEDHE
ncbi:kelch repeat and BTB domain-containing protein 13-like [Alosa sapidissima]|uniref:kelch repeat and BTB domain-containing protein 13-like n=1 Tax=Alosa sapidissima TaxID=34773 RepID=UPI001C0A3C04|nr:kelch repeat and BTB domain-containing protein 13-like [Alosa sapidissima]